MTLAILHKERSSYMKHALHVNTHGRRPHSTRCAGPAGAAAAVLPLHTNPAKLKILRRRPFVQVNAGGGHTAFKLHTAPDRLELLLPCVLFGVRSQREALMAEVAMNLDFAPRLHAAAKRISGAL